jgi:hypothetical protein
MFEGEIIKLLNSLIKEVKELKEEYKKNNPEEPVE